MIFTTFLLFFMQGGDAPPPPGRGAPVIQFRSRVVIRVPAIAPLPRTARPAPPVQWKENKGPRCVPSRAIRGFAISAERSLDMVLMDGSRLRARFDGDCGGPDFRSGIYIHLDEDRMICADRDAIHARSGGSCEIERFRKLSVKR